LVATTLTLAASSGLVDQNPDFEADEFLSLSESESNNAQTQDRIEADRLDELVHRGFVDTCNARDVKVALVEHDTSAT